MSKKSNRLTRKPMAEQLEARAMMAADAEATWASLTSQPLIGEKQTLQLRFDNVGNLAGFGPYIDVILPTKGQGDKGGVQFVPGSAILLDTPLRETVLTFDVNGKATHPLAKDVKGNPVVLQGVPGSQLVVLELPFGSFVADQPSVQIEMQVSVDPTAELGQSIQLVAAGGFQFGNDALNNPTQDPSIRGASVKLDLVPNVVSTKLEYLGPEDETANGPSFIRAYRVSVDVANGAQIDRLQLTNGLAANTAFLGLSDATWKSDQYKVLQAPVIGQPAKDAVLQLELPTIQGVTGVDGSYIVKFYVPEADASNAIIIDPVKAASAKATFTSQAAGDWVKPPVVVGDAPVVQSIKTNIAAHELQAKAIAVQQSAKLSKDVNASGVGPGDTVEYALRFQVSDFVRLSNVILETEIPNGMELVSEEPVLFSISGVDGLDASKSIKGQLGLVREGDAKSGGQTYRFYLSKELQTIGLTGSLFGALTEKGIKTGVEGTVTYRTRVLDSFQRAVPSSDLSIDERDVFPTTASGSGTTLLPEKLTSSGIATQDGSGTRLQVPNGRLQTSVYAINGKPVASDRQATAGDLVTYRITRTVNSSDIEDLVLNDYLPLPIHSVASVRWVDTGSVSENGALQLGPQDTFHALYGSKPKATLDVANNRVSLNYGKFDSEKNQTTTIDLLLTVVIEDKPFADGMWLTNLANASYGSSNNGNASQNALSNIRYTRPVLNIVKGIIDTDNPRGRPSPAGSNDANVSGVDAGDKVRFQVLVTNTGLSRNGAFDALIKDAMPAGYIIPSTGLDLKVVDGTGKEWKLSPENPKDANPLFGSGLRLNEAIPGANSASGTNQVILSYTLEVSESAKLLGNYSSEAQVVSYAAIPKGSNYVTSKIADSAWTRIANASVVHSLVSTDLPTTTGNRLVIGETGTFLARVALPEGTMNAATLVINEPRGLAIKEVVSVSASNSLKFVQYSQDDIRAKASVVSTSKDDRDAARQVTLHLGDVVNTDRDNTQIEYIDIVYTATATNDIDSQAGITLRSVATITHQSGTASSTVSTSIAEPSVDVVKTWKIPVVDAMDKVTIVMDVRSPSTGATAYDISFIETIPAGIAYIPGSLRLVSATAKPSSFNDIGGVIRATWDSLSPGQTARFEYDVIVANDVHAGQIFNTEASAQWSSLPGAPGEISATSPLAVERTGDVKDAGTVANDYRKSYTSTLTIAPVKMAMKLVDSSHTFTSGSDVTIGERATFEIVATIPEGRHKLELSSLTSKLAPSLVIESLELVSIGGNLSGDVLKVGLQGTVAGDSLAKIDLGIVTNKPDNVSNASDQLVFRIKTRVPNKSENVAGLTPVAEASMDYRYGVASTNSALRIVEPSLQIKQTVSRTIIDANDVVDATISIVHTPGSTSAGLLLKLQQAVSQAGLQLVPGSITLSSGKLISGNSAGDSTIQVESNDLALGKELKVSYKVQVSKDAKPGEQFELPTTLAWFSMNGDDSRSYSTNSTVALRVGSSGLVGSVFVDNNQDGVFQTGDYNIADVKIVLSGIDHLGNPVVANTTTDANGFYRFAGLRPGVYTLSEIQTVDFTDGLDYAGTLGGTIANDAVSNIVIPAGSNSDFGRYRFTESPLTWISGTVFVDQNQNRKLEAEEEGVEGIVVTLTGKTKNGEPVNMTTTTNARGYYVFGYIEAGTYSVIEGATPGYLDAAEQIGTRGGRVGADRFENVTVSASKPGDFYNFGEYRPGVIQGQIYIDYDRDGVLDRKDGLIANVTVTLNGINDLGEVTNESVMTDYKGKYRFENLRPGMYSIQSDAQDGLDYSVSNVGIYNGGARRDTTNGLGSKYGFTAIQLPAGAIGNGYNVGHVDPNFDPSILGEDFQQVIVINGTKGDDVFKVQMTEEQATIDVNGQVLTIDNKELPSIRIMGSFGRDWIDFIGSSNKEQIELRQRSARITGTWFETLIYGMESINFDGGGYEDVARFYDSPLNDVFSASPMTAKMVGSDYSNSVQGVHRIYAYATDGNDSAMLTGASGITDYFNAAPDSAKLYGDDFYLYTTDFDSAVGIATDVGDRAYLFDSVGNDALLAGENSAILSGPNYHLTASGYKYVQAEANAGGTDRATLTGTSGNDNFTSYPLNTTLDANKTRIRARGFENTIVSAGNGRDTATVFDSQFQDSFTVQPGSALLRNSIGDVQMNGFERVTARMEAGGEDTAVIRGSSSVDTFKSTPDSWSFEGSGYAFFGVGFTKVTAYGESNDIANLVDTAYNDVLELTQSRATLIGQRFQNEANGFGRVNVDAQGGFDRIVFYDSAIRSNIEYDGTNATISGTGFNYNATGFESIDAYYADIEGLDTVDLTGKIEYAMMASDIATAKNKLSIRASATASPIKIQNRVDRL